MSMYKLKFESPKFIRNIDSPQELVPKDWFYSKTNDDLEIDVLTWYITCPNQDKTAKINTWYFNEDTYEFQLKEDEGFKKVDYVFAVSMITQICGKEETIAYLLQLQDVFDISQENKNQDNHKEE